jgi:threonine/homoserine/homoserine lactone efflux protein
MRESPHGHPSVGPAGTRERGYALLAAKISSVLTRPAVKAALDGVTGVILVGLGIRLALERR